MSDRNAAISSSTDKAMTNPTTGARCREISAEVSMDAAVWPPISAVAPVLAVALGTTALRR